MSFAGARSCRSEKTPKIRARRGAGIGLAVALVLTGGGVAVISAPGAAVAAPELTRIAGADRYATSVAISRTSRPEGAPVAFLATGTNFPDALAGAAAAAKLGGPVLLSGRNQAPAVVLEELVRLNPERVIVLGGSGAVGESVADQVRSRGLSVERLAGLNRYETSAMISRTSFEPGAARVFVATGEGFADALAGSAAAGREGAPVLLVGADTLPEATEAELMRLGPERITVLGGSRAVSARVESALAQIAPVSRVAGVDRYETAGLIAQESTAPSAAVFLATGSGFADALSGAPAAAAAGAPMLLTPTSCVSAAARNQMQRLGYPPVRLLGGESALSVRVAQLAGCHRVPDGALAPGVSLRTIKDARGPWTGKIVNVAPAERWRLDTMLGQNRLGGLETTSSMARRSGALAAINGDFFLPDARPVHAFAKDGRLIQTPSRLGRNFALGSATGTGHAGFPQFDISLHVPSQGARAPISRVNLGASGTGALAMTTPTGKRAAPENSCGVRLGAPSAPSLDDGGKVSQSYTVEQIHCGAAPIGVSSDVLTTPMEGVWAPLLRSLSQGERVEVSWSAGWPSVLDMIGGNPVLIDRGRIAAEDVDGDAPFVRDRHPRTAVGQRADGTLLLVIVNGRGVDGSVGMSLRELANLMAQQGAVTALNLDGGGSTAMAIGGETQNTPSDGAERPVSTALIIRGGTKPAEGSSLEGSTNDTTPVELSAQERARGIDAEQADPASTGGLLGT